MSDRIPVWMEGTGWFVVPGIACCSLWSHRSGLCQTAVQNCRYNGQSSSINEQHHLGNPCCKIERLGMALQGKSAAD